MTVRLASTDPDPARRLQHWHDAVCDTFVDLDCRVSDRDGFRGSIASDVAGDVSFSTVDTIAQVVERTPARVRRAREAVVLISVQLTGTGRVLQDGRVATLAAGDLAIYDSTRPYTLAFDAPFQQLVVHLPRARFTQHLGETRDFTAVPISTAEADGAIASAYIRQLAQGIERLEPQAGERLAGIGIDLVSACLSRRRALSAPAKAGRAMLVERVRALVEQHLANPDLDTARLAQAVHVSERYLQQAFRDEGNTVSALIRTRRLERARGQLGNPALARLNVQVIAQRCGFTDAAHFCRAFRDAFGMAPSEYRAGAGRG